jgi:SAM-dependent methyltransferase
MAETVGPEGRVIGVERDPMAIEHAKQVVAAAGAKNVELRQGNASATGIEPGSVDVAVMRHVLAHNGGHEQEIVDHLASLVRPGGHVYLVDVDLTGIRARGMLPELEGLFDFYAEFHRRRGNDPMIGLRLGELATNAGLEDVVHQGAYTVLSIPPGLRPPPWIARDQMLADGVVTQADVDRWGEAFDVLDKQAERPTLFASRFWAIGRRPTS